ncbi:MAG: HD domain-containing protein [Candidatus Aminicenantes bacterium]|nr:HD domain-containing protein [Candidatus Aminicenantes bacterium]
MSLFESVKDRYIKDLKVGAKVDWYYKLAGISKKTKRDGGLYLALELMDKTGKIPAKVWDNVEACLKLLQEGKVYRLTGSVNEFMSKKEIKVDGIRAINPMDKDFSEADFVEQAGFDTETLFNGMIDTLKTNIENPHLLQLIDLFVQRYKEKFKTHYGAQKIHHAYLGGLLKHTQSMLELALFVARHYSLDKELLLTGVLFHDIGKMFEFKISPAVSLTAEGGLLGHLIIGSRIFTELSGQVKGFPEDLSLKIGHLIISHHGEKEFGSPEVPKIPEAFALHAIDLLDSKLNIMAEAIGSADSKDLFTEYLYPLGRRLYTGGAQENSGGVREDSGGAQEDSG